VLGVTRQRGRIAIHRCGPGGAILGTVDLFDLVTTAEARRRWPDQAPYISGPWCWLLRDPQPLPEPIPCPGCQRLWHCDRYFPVLPHTT
jgi:hypothetical protein